MNKIQKLSFNDLGEFLDYLPENELQVVEELRRIIYDCIPEIKEKLSYNVPFFSLKKSLCHIWPSSIPWGNIPDNYVALGFKNGHLMPDPFNKLEQGSRKFIRVMYFKDMDEIDVEMVRFYVFEALNLDQ